MIRTALLMNALMACRGAAAPASVLASDVSRIGLATPDATSDAARAVVAFWREAGPAMWFAKDPAFDARFRERFALDYAAASQGDRDAWQRTAEGSLALLILLDQYPRNSFRESPRMYATDALARRIARAAIEAGQHEQVEPSLRTFFVLPFAHSEDLADQEARGATGQRHRAGGPRARRASPRHREALRAVSAPERDPGPRQHTGGGRLPGERRLPRLTRDRDREDGAARDVLRAAPAGHDTPAPSCA